MIDLTPYKTEGRNPRTMNLDLMTPYEIASALNKEDEKAVLAVRRALPSVAIAIDHVVNAFKNGGRLIYIGAGTSGRLGVLDAVECPPTFGTAPEKVVGLIAGGKEAFVRAIEGAEDSVELCKKELNGIDLNENDIVVGLTASGRTPYVYHGLKYAKELSCKTIAIACNKNSEVGEIADIAIEVETGPEALTGSTRLKAGSAQKMILNMISTASMVRMGKVYENLMVDMKSTNDKLAVRAENIVIAATSCQRDEAKDALEKSAGSSKIAITMLLLNESADNAKKLLADNEDNIRKAIENKDSK